MQKKESGIRRFEVVSVVADGPGCREFTGQLGTVIWCDPAVYRRGEWTEWGYCVYFPTLDRYASFLESSLQPTGRLDAEEAHQGRRFELSFDTVVGEDADVVEGSYRVPGRPWEIFLFEKRDIAEPRHHFSTWRSGITGLEFFLPKRAVLDREAVLRGLAEVFSTQDWVEVRGPDSLLLK
ncbi:Hypothetical protein AA314_09987 [Archangium gephyra]|uniref:Uncharacterized protein n=1 Tax=Archangium gephyra TaxID=48 RepID=A0AAC8QJH0_9BACT|nr:hypothetical protein [Archangium gephyra]AKJ08361.1 Hypothetical protein AA314_09987 [Archangium gephyra]